jgi:hypothetical protein
VLLQVAKACSVDRSLILVTPATVLQAAMVAAVSRFLVFSFFALFIDLLTDKVQPLSR